MYITKSGYWRHLDPGPRGRGVGAPFFMGRLALLCCSMLGTLGGGGTSATIGVQDSTQTRFTEFEKQVPASPLAASRTRADSAWAACTTSVCDGMRTIAGFT